MEVIPLRVLSQVRPFGFSSADDSHMCSGARKRCRRRNFGRNHDYGSERLPPNDTVADSITARLRALGINVVRNDREHVQGLHLVGVDDLWGGHFDPQAALAKLPAKECAKIVLCHNPDAVDQPVWSGYQGWILCGHTHGGQCKSPLCRPPVLPVANKRYTAGEIDLFDGRKLYINRGLGYRHRVRFNVRPEITVFTLTRGAITQQRTDVNLGTARLLEKNPSLLKCYLPG